MPHDLNGPWTSWRVTVDHTNGAPTIDADGTIMLVVDDNGNLQSASRQPIIGGPINMSGRIITTNPNFTLISLKEEPPQPGSARYVGRFTKDSALGTKTLSGIFNLRQPDEGLESQAKRSMTVLQAQDNGVWVSTQP